MLSGVAFALDRRSRVPVYRQLYNRTRAAIASGQLRSGERLPSARSLAAQLGAARGTVDAAYAMLAAEGWIVARGPAGTIVAPDLAEKLRGWAPTVTATRRGASKGLAAEIPPRPFQMGLPALDAFPASCGRGSSRARYERCRRPAWPIVTRRGTGSCARRLPPILPLPAASAARQAKCS